MQKWEYRIFASHLDPAELVVIMNESGKDGWELVTVVAVTDYQPLALLEPAGEVKIRRSRRNRSTGSLQIHFQASCGVSYSMGLARLAGIRSNSSASCRVKMIHLNCPTPL